MSNIRKPLATLAAAAVVASGLILGLAGGASASGAPPWEPDANSVGGLIFYNSAGQQVTGGNLTDSPIAAYVEGTSTIRAGDTKATLFGYLPKLGEAPGAWGGEALGSSTVYPVTAAPAPLNTATLPVETGASGDESIAQLESDYPNTDTSNDGYAGIYVLRLKTSAEGLSQTADYDSADILISGSTWAIDYDNAQTATTTALAASPPGPVTQGTSVSLSATVSPYEPGTVQFEVGGSDIGSPEAVTADTGDPNGTATISTTSLPVSPTSGSDALTAVFTPEFSVYAGGSTGTGAIVVNQAPAVGTTTALAVANTSPAEFASDNITATVTQTSDSSPLGASAGEVTFYNTDANGDITSQTPVLGTEPLDSSGNAVLSYSFPSTATYNIVAEFVPTDPTAYNSSVSTPVISVTPTAPQYAPASQTVDVSIPAGTLTITTPYGPGNPFQLGTASLNSTGTAFTASAAFGASGSATSEAQGVTITDTRAGDQSWTASATATSFTDGSGDSINAENLTFTGVAAAYLSGNALQSGDVTVNDITDTLPNGLPYGAGASGTDGLAGGPHQFATATNGDGSVYIDGTLNLVAPTSTPAGSYTATLTFTIT